MTDETSKLHAKAGKIWVTRTIGNFPEEHHESNLEVSHFETHPAWVNAKYGLTMNLGNYESARVDCGVTLPCYVEEIPEAFEEAWEIAKREIQEQAKGIKK